MGSLAALISAGSGYVETIGANTGASTGTTITASGSANVKGSWTQLIASTAEDYDGLLVYLAPGAAANRSFLVDIGIGAAASETVIIPDLLEAHSNPGDVVRPGCCYKINIAIPKGSRLAARCQCSTASGTTTVLCVPFREGNLRCGQWSAIGVTTANSNATSVDPGASANTKGSWVELVASTSYDIDLLIVALGSRDQTGSIVTCSWLVDIGVGAAGSEVVIVPNLWTALTDYSAGAACQSSVPVTPPIVRRIPAGSRIAARAQCSSATATQRLLRVAAYGGH